MLYWITALFLFGFPFFAGAASFDFNINLIIPNNSALNEIVELDASGAKSEYEDIEDAEKFKSDIDLLNATKLKISITGQLKQKKGWNVTFNNKLVQVDSSGAFTLTFSPKAANQAYGLTLISNEGSVKSDKIGIQIGNFKEFLVFLKEKKTPLGIFASIGSGAMSYSQTNVPDLEQGLLHLQFLKTVDFDPGNIFGNLAFSYFYPLNKPDPPIATISYIKGEAGLNKFLRGDYLPSMIRHMVITAGLMYHGTLVEPEIFGFPGISGTLGRILFAFNIGKDYEFDLSAHYGSFLWGGDSSSPAKRELMGSEFSFAPAKDKGGQWRTSFQFETVKLEEGNVSVVITSLNFGYLFQL